MDGATIGRVQSIKTCPTCFQYQSQTSIKRLGAPWGQPPCTPNSENTDHSHPTYKYSLTACKKQCYQTELIDACSCATDVEYVSVEKCSYLNTTQRKYAHVRTYNKNNVQQKYK